MSTSIQCGDKLLLYSIVIIEGFCVMAIELLIARMFIPIYGSSLYVWGTVIALTMIGLAIGYYIGGHLSDKNNELFLLLKIILTTSVIIQILPVFSSSFILSFEKFQPYTAVLISSVILVVIPISLLGIITSFVIKIMTTHFKVSGKISGKIYTLSTLGGITGAFTMGFFFIPEYGIKNPCLFTGMLLGIIPFFIMLKEKKKYCFIYLIFIPVYYFLHKPVKLSPGFQVLHKSEGTLGQILVTDVPRFYNGEFTGTDRMLFVNRMGQTWVNTTNWESRWSYVNYITSLSSILPEKSKVLLLGLGGGTVANRLYKDLKFSVDAVELDQRIVNLAKHYFLLHNEINVFTDDARHYVRTCKKKYDLIIFDLFKGEIPPSHGLSMECFEEVKKILNPEGIIIINFNGFVTEKKEGLPTRSLIKTLTATGFKVKLVSTFEEVAQRNNLIIGSLKNLDTSKIKIPLHSFYPPFSGRNIFYPLEEINLNNALVLTDDKPLLEVINLPAAEIWRKGYNENFTKMFKSKGIPLY